MELNHAVLAPLRAAADMGLNFWQNPVNPLSSTSTGRAMSASLEMLEHTAGLANPYSATRRPSPNGVTVGIRGKILLQRPFVPRFCISARWLQKTKAKPQEKLLVVAPMSRPLCTSFLLRGTVQNPAAPLSMFTSPIGPTRAPFPWPWTSRILEDYVTHLIENSRAAGQGRQHHGRVPAFGCSIMAAVSLFECKRRETAPEVHGPHGRAD